jgi:hypothetical protein
MIDFGYSAITANIDDQVVPVNYNLQFFSLPNEIALLGDIFKILGFLSLLPSSDGNKAIVEEVLKFWVHDPNLSTVDFNTLRLTYFLLPKNDNRTFKDLWNYLLTNQHLNSYVDIILRYDEVPQERLLYLRYRLPAVQHWTIMSPLEYLIRLANGWKIELPDETVQFYAQEAWTLRATSPAIKNLIDYIINVRLTRLARGLPRTDRWIHDIEQFMKDASKSLRIVA